MKRTLFLLMYLSLATVCLAATGDIHDAAKKGDLAKVKDLLVTDPSANLKDESGNTPLHYAAMEGWKDVVELLLVNKADVNAKNNRGATPLHAAVANVGSREYMDVLKFLLANKADVTAKDKNGQAPLHHAAFWKSYGSRQMAELLLENKADVNAKDDNGFTPLHITVSTGALHGEDEEMAKLLLANKADVNAKTKAGWTPLHYAAQLNKKAVAELLLANKADINAKDNDGATPLGVAPKSASYNSTRELLRMHGGKDDLGESNKNAVATPGSSITYGTFQDGQLVPTTAPTMNQDTPRGAIKVYWSSHIRRDAAALRLVVATSNPTEKKALDTIADHFAAKDRLYKTMLDTFKEMGVSNAEDVAISQIATMVDAAKETIDGNTATVQHSTDPIRCVRVDGKWKICFSSFCPVADESDMEKQLNVVRATSKVFNKTADDVKAGKYKTAQEVQDSLAQAIKEAMSDQPVSKPDTPPTTQSGDQAGTKPQKVKADVVCLINSRSAIYFGALTYGIDAQFTTGVFMPPDPTKQTVVLLVKNAASLIPSLKTGKAYLWRGGKDVVLLGDVDFSKGYVELIASYGLVVGKGATEQGQVPKDLTQ